jgi:hypothetical protein
VAEQKSALLTQGSRREKGEDNCEFFWTRDNSCDHYTVIPLSLDRDKSTDR